MSCEKHQIVWRGGLQGGGGGWSDTIDININITVGEGAHDAN